MNTPSLLPSRPVHIGRVLRSAAVFDFQRHTTSQSFMNADNISREAEELFDLLAARGVPYLLVGGLAMLTHVKGRNTDDVGLIISVPDQRRLEPEVALLDSPEPGSPFALGHYKQLRVDYLDAAAPIFAWVLKEHCERQVFTLGGGERKLPVATAKGLMLLKLFALPNVTRRMDWERVTAYESDVLMLWLAHPDTDPRLTLRALRPFVDEHAFYSLAHEVVPDMVRRWERYMSRPVPAVPPSSAPG